MQYWILFAALLFFAVSLGYLWYSQRVVRVPYTVNSMSTEVFCCKLVGYGRLQTSGNNGSLQPGYNYATASEINAAQSNGLRISGVASGDCAIYLDDGYMDPTKAPNLSLLKAGDFSTGNYVTLVNTTTYLSQTNYYVFLKGYKPLSGTDLTTIFQSNSNIVSYVGILPWNSTTWNSDTDGTSSDGNEVFLATIVPASTDITFINDSLSSGYSLATSDQIYWSVSRGLNSGMCNIVTFLNESSLVSTYIPFNCMATTGVYAFWGKKPATSNGVFSTFSSTTIQKFNNKKYSLYN